MKKEVFKSYTTDLLARQVKEASYPALYQVVVHNDDFTPMEFVVKTLESFFYMDRRKAAAVMMEAHMKGDALCGVFSKDFAESKVAQVIDYAKLHEHPLICTMEIINI